MRLLLGLLLPAALVAQSPSLPHVVFTRLPGANPVAQLVEVHATTGAVQTLGRFPSDSLPPLAVAFDIHDGAILVAVDQGGGVSRLVRLVRSGAGFTEHRLAVVSGRAVGLVVQHDELLVGVDAPGGGIYRVDRRAASVPVQVMAQPNLTALHGLGQTGTLVMVAWTGRPGTAAPDSGTGMFEYGSGQFWFGPDTFPNPSGAEITGVVDLPTGVPRQFLSFDSGAFALFAGLIGPVATPVPTTPAIPVGGAAAMHPAGPYSFSPWAVGGAPYPYLYQIDAWAGTVAVKSAALPGSPVDFAFGLETGSSLNFGAPCGPTAISLLWRGLPRLGWVLDLTVGGPANAWVFLVGGFDDFAGGALPAVLPGGCRLEVSPEALLLEQLNGAGAATRSLSIPVAQWLFGSPLFFQCAHLDPVGFSTSNSNVHWIGM